jgi:ATP-dependent Clp protease ATP-binding subunit ClpC
VLELFTERSRLAVVQAGDIARELGHAFIGAEHLLLGVIADRFGIAARALDRVGVSDGDLRRELLARHPRGDRPTASIPFSPEGKSVLELSLTEVRRLDDPRIETEHMLLALLKTEEQSAVALLAAVGVDAERVRVEVVRLSTSRRSLLAEVHSPQFGVWKTVGPNGHLRHLLVDAAELAVECGRSTIEVEDVLFAIVKSRDLLPLLTELGVQHERVDGMLAAHRSR